MKKAIVFGGSGFVGSHVADALTREGIQTTIFDLTPSPYLREDQTFIQGNILDETAVHEAVKGNDYVYHFAGQADIEEGFQAPRSTIELNVVGTANILEACRKAGIERFVFASTIYVYSSAGGFYRVSKQACELLIEEYHKVYGLNYTILRYGSLYGPRADDRNLIYRILKEATLSRTITIGYKPEEKRDYIHVHDAARMSVKALSDEYINSHVMLTGYQSIERGELINMICEMLGGDIQIYQVKPEIETAQGHYKFTPYVFKPQVSKKILSSDYIELGQGLLICIEDIYEKHLEDNAEKTGT